MNPVAHNIPKYESNLYSSNFLSSSALFDSVNKAKTQETLAQKTKTKDSISTLLSSLNDIDETCIVDNFMKANIATSDLASLSKVDLELLGIKIQQQQNDLLDSFRRLPKQDISYEK